MTAKDRQLAERIHHLLDRHFPHADSVATNIVKAARAARPKIDVSTGCGLIEQESGFQNVFGHDPTIFVGEGRVTEDKYEHYKRERGHTRMQGVGYTQLTWWEYQDRADEAGGCWKPYPNILTGFELIGEFIEQHGRRKGLAIYNGGASRPNYTYADEVIDRIKRWHDWLT